MIDGVACKIVEYEKSKPGKHGSAKARVVGIGIFDGSKKSLVSPVSGNVEVPIIEKRTGQVISLAGSNVQLMDLETFEVFEVPNSKEEKISSKLQSGTEVEYWKVLGKGKIMRVKG